MFEISFSNVDPLPVTQALDTHRIQYRATRRRGFDGMTTVSLAIEAIAGLGGMLTPIVLHLMASKKEDADVTISGITLRGLKEEQVRRIIEQLAEDRGGDEVR
ncbi:MAG TPA: hypothetical protein VN231_06820 [Allosphingosinicella sp.]|nr:hypothetical protein [Allosphingosinicella sp.]